MNTTACQSGAALSAETLSKTLPSHDASSAEDVPQPLRRARGVEQHGVHATRRHRRQSAQIQSNRALNPRLFICANAGCRAAKPHAVALPYFNKHKHRTIAHDEVNFAEPTMPVALDEREAVRLQQRFGFAFVALTGAGFGVKAQLSPDCAREIRRP